MTEMTLVYDGEVVPQEKHGLYKGLDGPLKGTGEILYNSSDRTALCGNCRGGYHASVKKIGIKQDQHTIHHRTVSISACACSVKMEISR